MYIDDRYSSDRRAPVITHARNEVFRSYNPPNLVFVGRPNIEAGFCCRVVLKSDRNLHSEKVEALKLIQLWHRVIIYGERWAIDLWLPGPG